MIFYKRCFDYDSMEREAAALIFYDGAGSVRLLNRDEKTCTLALEQVIPGTTLKSLFPVKDDDAVKIASEVIKPLQKKLLPSDAQFPSVNEWVEQAFYASKGTHLEKAKSIANDLLRSPTSRVLLHGDLHHDNILLDAQRGWIAIDPKGVIGEPEYDVGAFLRNPIDELLTQPNAREIMARRIELFSELLGFDKQRLKCWNFVQAALAFCWAIEDGQPADIWLRYLELISEK